MSDIRNAMQILKAISDKDYGFMKFLFEQNKRKYIDLDKLPHFRSINDLAMISIYEKNYNAAKYFIEQGADLYFISQETTKIEPPNFEAIKFINDIVYEKTKHIDF